MELRQDADREDLPGTIDEVVRVAEQTEGVHLDRLITALQPDRQAAAGALAEILRAAAETGPGQDPAIQDHLQRWEPVIAATVAAAGGDSGAAAQLAPVLDQLAQRAGLGRAGRRAAPHHRRRTGTQPAAGPGPGRHRHHRPGPVPARPATGHARAGGSMTGITDTIAALTGEEAIRVLADTADYQTPATRPGPAARPRNRPARRHR